MFKVLSSPRPLEEDGALFLAQVPEFDPRGVLSVWATGEVAPTHAAARARGKIAIRVHDVGVLPLDQRGLGVDARPLGPA